MATDKVIEEFVEQLTNVREDKNRLRLLKAWLGSDPLTCSQCMAITNTFFGLGDTKIQAVTAMYPHVSDQDNFESQARRVIATFPYPEEKADIKRALGL